MQIHIQTFGCTLNQSDSEMMAGLLAIAGHELVEKPEDAEIIIYNTCTVKDSPEKSFYSMMQKQRAAGKKVIVAGCVSQADPNNPKLKDISIIGVRHLEMVADVVEAVSEGRVVKLLSWVRDSRINMPKIRKNPVVEIIPISSGCLGNCTFCKTKAARGGLMSYDPLAIKKQMQDAIAEGVKEVWLTSQDSGAYGLELKTNLVNLLDELVKVPGDYRIRLGMINPDLAKDMIPGLIRFLNHEHAFKFIHIPAQSGSDKVLGDMKRRYTRKQFYELVDELRREVPRLTVATDIITGFPGETEEDHADTVALFRDLLIPVINLTKFYPRAGTPAAAMKLHPTKLVKQRSKELSELQASLISNREWLGWTGRVVIDEKGKDRSWVGRNDWYKPVVIKSAKLKLGQTVNVEITGVTQHYLVGKIHS